MTKTEAESDVPYGEDLQSVAGANAWAAAADEKRPSRKEFRDAIVEELVLLPPGSKVLELGSGPGLLAETVLKSTSAIASYTLFDFSEPMLEMSRLRVGYFPAARFVLGDFRDDDWPELAGAPFQAVVSTQAIHELRHKRHAPKLYRQIFESLGDSGIVMISDHTPSDDTWPSRALYMTPEEQIEALTGAGFTSVHIVKAVDRLVLYQGLR